VTLVGKRITQEKADAYVSSGGCHCPYCGGDKLEGTSEFGADGNEYYHEIECLDCGRHWNDLYVLKGIGVWGNDVNEEGYEEFYREGGGD